MRPASIVNFERVVILSLLVGLVATAVNWEHAVQATETIGFGSGLVIGVQVVSIALTLLLLYFISRRGSSVARWIYVVLVGLAVAFSLANASAVFVLPTVPVLLQLVQWLLSIISIWLLFTADARAWFNRSTAEDVEPDAAV